MLDASVVAAAHVSVLTTLLLVVVGGRVAATAVALTAAGTTCRNANKCRC